MFYLGGMTLGYFAPPQRKTAARKETVAACPSADDDAEERDRQSQQEWARAFLTPWHLFY
jgi:hypothetical protein